MLVLFRILVFICARLEHLLSSQDQIGLPALSTYTDGATAPSFYYLNLRQCNLELSVDHVFYLQNLL